jgi:hypothetical protein
MRTLRSNRFKPLALMRSKSYNITNTFRRLKNMQNKDWKKFA